MLAQQVLLDILQAALEADPPLFDGGVGRQRTRTLPADFTGAVNVRAVRADPTDELAGFGAPVHYTTRIGLECIGKVLAPNAPDEAAGAVLTLAHGRIMAYVSALQTAGFEIDPSPSLMWDQDELDERIGAVTAIYNFRHTCSPSTLA
jgi:hypothetical protein